MKVLKLIVSLAVVVAIAIGGLYLYNNDLRKETAPELRTVDLEGTIRDIGELATAEYGYTITQVMDKPSWLKISSAKVLYSYEGIIKAGIDFTKVGITVNKAQKMIYIKIPSAKILSNELDNDSLQIYDEKYSMFNKIKFEDVNTSQADAKKTAEEKALESGLLERAEENAESIIEKTVLSLRESEEYQVKFC